jgi:hypothetical protein
MADISVSSTVLSVQFERTGHQPTVLQLPIGDCEIEMALTSFFHGENDWSLLPLLRLARMSLPILYTFFSFFYPP